VPSKALGGWSNSVVCHFDGHYERLVALTLHASSVSILSGGARAMRSWNLLSAVGVAIVAAWLAVTNLAYAAEFTCIIPWHGSTDTCFPQLDIPARGLVEIEVYTVQLDGEDVGGDVQFKILDTEQYDIPVHVISIGARSTGRWRYESSEKLLKAKIRVNHPKIGNVVVRGRYAIK
jgi:hypothetical protein